MDDLSQVREVEKEFEPALDADKVARLLKRWHKAVDRSREWVDSDDN